MRNWVLNKIFYYEYVVYNVVVTLKRLLFQRSKIKQKLILIKVTV